MDTFKFPNSPGTPLFPLSPERVDSSNNTRCSPLTSAAASPAMSTNVSPRKSQMIATTTTPLLSPFQAPSTTSPSKIKHEFGKSTPLVAYTAAGTARPITAALAASMAATPTIAPFQLEIAKTPPRSPFRAHAAAAGAHVAGVQYHAHHSRNNSDAMVQGMIARFDGLSVRDWKSQGETAVRRADMAREVAEMESERLRKQIRDEEEERVKAREEGRKMKREIEDGKEKERKMARRIEVLMDELNRAKDTHGHTIAVYEKEVRKTRKDALKSASGLIKAQEEFKATKAQLRAAQTNLETERLKAAKREQESFTAQYQLVGVQEELHRAMECCKVVEEERDALKTNLKEEELLRVAAEGRIALPNTKDEDEDLLLLSPLKSPAKSPRKMQRQPVVDSDSEKENTQPMRQGLVQLKALQEELALERRLRQRALDQVDFMKMECQFQNCSCRLAEQRGQKYVHDATFITEMENIRSSMPSLAVQPAECDIMEVDVLDFASNDVEVQHSEPEIDKIIYPEETLDQPDTIEAQETSQEVIANSEEDVIVPLKPNSERRVSAMAARRSARRESLRQASFEATKVMNDETEGFDTIHTETPVLFESVVEAVEEAHDTETSRTAQSAIFMHDLEQEETDTTPLPESPIIAMEPQTPAGLAIRTITTTTTIPMQFSPIKQQQEPFHAVPSLPSTPRTIAHPPYYHASMNDENRPPPTPNGVFKADGTIDREAALEMIRQRRSRATSLKIGEATPKKQMVQGNIRRDISAPHVGKAATR